MKQNYYYPKLPEDQLILKREAGMMKVMTMKMKKKRMRMKEVMRMKMKKMRTKKMKKSIHLSRMHLMGKITTWIKLLMNKRKK